MSRIAVREVPGGVRFAVRVQPRARRSGIRGVHGDALKLCVTAPPVDGAANEAIIALLATELDVPTSAVRIVSGASSRTKTVEIAGVARDAVDRLASRCASG